MGSENRDLTIEESFNELDRIINTMQSQELSLEDTFNLYKEGLALVQGCNNKIEKIQCDIHKLNGVEE